jgi:hypothetical protein
VWSTEYVNPDLLFDRRSALVVNGATANVYQKGAKFGRLLKRAACEHTADEIFTRIGGLNIFGV